MTISSRTAVPLAEAKNKLSQLVERVSRGEEFVITRHGIEVARLGPATGVRRADVGEAIARMRAGRAGRRAARAELRAWRSQGRP